MVPTIMPEASKKTDLLDEIGISSSTLAKMSHGDEVSMSILSKICKKYKCDYGDIVNYVENGKES